MNVKEIVPDTKGSIPHYVVTTIGFTLLSVWVITAFQSRYIFRPGVTFWKRLGWPVFLLLRLFGKDPYAPTTPDTSEEDIALELTTPERQPIKYIFFVVAVFFQASCSCAQQIIIKRLTSVGVMDPCSKLQ